jgi:hypothetical protein
MEQGGLSSYLEENQSVVLEICGQCPLKPSSFLWTLDGAIMARWRPLTWHYLIYFDDCGFGKYWVISFRLALLMPLKPSHNLLVRGSNPCGGTNEDCRFAIVDCRFWGWRDFSFATKIYDGAIGARATSPALSAYRERVLRAV